MQQVITEDQERIESLLADTATTRAALQTRNLSEVLSGREASDLDMSGYLYENSSKGWGVFDGKRRYVTIVGGMLRVYKSLDEPLIQQSPTSEISLLLATVKDGAGGNTGSQTNADAISAFRVVSAQGQVALRASTRELKQQWVSCVNRNIEHSLNTHLDTSKSHGGKSKNAASDSASSPHVARLLAVPGNEVCADCNGPDPT